MNKEKQLLKNTTIVSLGKICTQLITFFLLPLYTAVLSTEEYGIVDLLNTLVSLFMPIATLQMEQGVFRYLLDAREKEKEQKKIISATIYFILCQVILYLAVFAVASHWIHNDYKYFLAINLVANVFSSIFLQISRGLGDNTKYAIGSFLSGAITVILNVLFIVTFQWGAYGMLVATFLGNLTCIFYIFFSKRLNRYISLKKVDKSLLKELLKYSIPLVPNMISWWVVNASDRMIITFLLNVAENGIYSAANKFSGLVSTLYSVFNLTWTESAAINIEAEDRDTFFNKILDFTIRFFGSVCIGIIAIMPFIFSIFINEKFAQAYYQIPILMIGTMFNILVSFLGSIYVAKKLTKEIAKTSILAAIINIAVNLLLISFIGLYAASISTAVAYFSMFVYRYIDTQKYVKLSVKKPFMISFILIAILTMLTYYIRNIYLCIIMAIIVIIYVVLINRNSMKFILQMLQKMLKRPKYNNV